MSHSPTVWPRSKPAPSVNRAQQTMMVRVANGALAGRISIEYADMPPASDAPERVGGNRMRYLRLIRFAKVSEIADRFRVSTDAVYLWIRQGKIPAECIARIAGTVRVDEEEFEQLLRSGALCQPRRSKRDAPSGPESGKRLVPTLPFVILENPGVTTPNAADSDGGR